MSRSECADILIVEDETDIRDVIAFHIRRSDHNPLPVANAKEAIQLLYRTTPDLVVLDWRLPDMSGLELLQRIRRQEATMSVPVLMLTARTSVDDKIRGLKSGADDYLVKPFSPGELKARINALLRRTSKGREELQLGPGVTLEPNMRKLRVLGKAHLLGEPETRILHYLAQHPNTACSRERLLASLWGQGHDMETRSVDVYISRLRRALGSKASRLQTLRGRGYYLNVKDA